MTEKQRERLEGLLAKARAQSSALSALKAKWKKLRAIRAWIEIDAGQEIKVGELCLYFGVIYECAEDHVKQRLDTPKRSAHWRVFEETAA